MDRLSARPGQRSGWSTPYFKGAHVVECYVIKDGIVVARDRIDVPIDNTSPRGESRM
ncbi:nucleotide-binding domain-containing protein [Rhodococcus rhodochrous]|uniref:nucleotide-binding domain-containing protein n=1 Tax=Rhodococcus rhodochrous TaxID=1829 RepID=UPI00384C6BB7